MVAEGREGEVRGGETARRRGQGGSRRVKAVRHDLRWSSAAWSRGSAMSPEATGTREQGCEEVKITAGPPRREGTSAMLDKLEAFIALARAQHFGKAAEELGVTQPTLSAAIKQLEGELGVMLVKRGSRFQGLTDEGEQVLGWARRISGDARAMREQMRSARHGLTGRLRTLFKEFF